MKWVKGILTFCVLVTSLVSCGEHNKTESDYVTSQEYTSTQIDSETHMSVETDDTFSDGSEDISISVSTPEESTPNSESNSETTSNSEDSEPVTQPDDNFLDNRDFAFTYFIDKNSYGIYGYFGNEERIVVPSTHRCLPVISIAFSERSAEARKSVRSIFIPKTIVSGSFGYWRESFENLEEIEVEEGNPAFCTKNGILYDKAMKKMLQYPPQLKSGSIIHLPETLETFDALVYRMMYNVEGFEISEDNPFFPLKMVCYSTKTKRNFFVILWLKKTKNTLFQILWRKFLKRDSMEINF